LHNATQQARRLALWHFTAAVFPLPVPLPLLPLLLIDDVIDGSAPRIVTAGTTPNNSGVVRSLGLYRIIDHGCSVYGAATRTKYLFQSNNGN